MLRDRVWDVTAEHVWRHQPFGTGRQRLFESLCSLPLENEIIDEEEAWANWDRTFENECCLGNLSGNKEAAGRAAARKNLVVVCRNDTKSCACSTRHTQTLKASTWVHLPLLQNRAIDNVVESFACCSCRQARKTFNCVIGRNFLPTKPCPTREKKLKTQVTFLGADGTWLATGRDGWTYTS